MAKQHYFEKIVEAKQHKGAVWAVKGAEHIRIHEIGNTWLADEYRNGEYVRNIMKHSYRSALIENLSKAGA